MKQYLKALGIIIIIFLFSLHSINTCINVAILSELKGITKVYKTVDSFSQEVDSTNNNIKLLIEDIKTATDRMGELAMVQKDFITLTRNEWNAIINLIDKKEAAK